MWSNLIRVTLTLDEAYRKRLKLKTSVSLNVVPPSALAADPTKPRCLSEHPDINITTLLQYSR